MITPQSCQDIRSRWEELDSFIEETRDHEHPQGSLIGVLHKTQELFGYLPQPALNHIAQSLKIPTAEIYGVATFYSYFSLVPKGKYCISVCLGTACYVRGSATILQTLQEELGISAKQTTEDGLFTLQEARCVGACGLAPVMIVNNDVYAQMNPNRVSEVIHKYRAQEVEPTS
ncbi:MAG: NADH-quinone oxidoreductase subunit NuoE [Armatimonadetes bacterium]|nr:NADH-quinone oxidoreductase subunit NuoE [Armatimonadota bacterium]